MNLLMDFLVAAALIAGMILLRMFMDRSARCKKFSSIKNENECEQVGCFRGCDSGKDTSEPHSVSGQNPSKRSAYHAP
jgi:hypothetical protein